MGETDQRLEKLRREVLTALTARADPDYRIGELVPTESPVLGVRVPVIRELVKEIKARHPELTAEDAIAYLDLVSKDRRREEMLWGILLLAGFRRRLPLTVWRHVDRWIDAIDNWEICDQLAMNVAGELVVKDLSRVDDLVKWAKSDNPWRRRFAVATTTALNQRGRSHPQETLRVLEPVLDDADPMIQKAVGWALREVSKRDEEATFRYLLERKQRIRRRILREGAEKLSPEHRARLLQS